MFFETHHSMEWDYFVLRTDKTAGNFPLHIHRAFECYAVIIGSAVATVNGVEYTLLPGEAVLVFPYQRHEYKTSPGTSTRICIFSPDLVGAFKKWTSLVPVSNKFALTPGERDPEGLLLQKATCYNICGAFDSVAEYVERSADEEDLLSKILLYVSEKYTTKLTLKDVSAHVGYDYSYISKLFKRTIGVTFKSYVNSIRINEACHLLLNREMSVCEVAEACGFSCIRTFNREFLKMVGSTPRALARSCAETAPSESSVIFD